MPKSNMTAAFLADRHVWRTVPIIKEALINSSEAHPVATTTCGNNEVLGLDYATTTRLRDAGRDR